MPRPAAPQPDAAGIDTREVMYWLTLYHAGELTTGQLSQIAYEANIARWPIAACVARAAGIAYQLQQTR